MTNSEFSQADLNQLYQKLNHHFDEEELRTLCFSLQVEYDTLPAQGKSNKARELVNYLARRDRISELLQLVQVERPSIEWNRSEGDYIDPGAVTEFVRLKFPSHPFAALITEAGPGSGEWIILTEQTRRIIFGRRKDADVPIPDIKLTGRHFAVIVRLEDDPENNRRHHVVEIMDMASTNGTYLNGRLIQERQPLKNGDRIQAGGSAFRYILLPSQTPLP